MVNSSIHIVKQELADLKPGAIPLELFSEIARLMVVPVMEVVPFKTNIVGEVEVLLLRKPTDDLLWANLYYVPGTIIVPMDYKDDMVGAYKRIIGGKLKNLITSKPVFVENQICETARGVELAMVYWVEVQIEHSVGEYFAWDKLPPMIKDHSVFVEKAVESYKLYRSS